jgi:hypothetical protein
VRASWIRAAARAGCPSIQWVNALWARHDTPGSCQASSARDGSGLCSRGSYSAIPPFQVVERGREFARVERDDPQRAVRPEEKRGFVRRLCHRQELPCHVTRGRQGPTNEIEPHEHEQHRIQLAGVLDPVAECAYAHVHAVDLGRRVAPGRRQRGGEHDLEREFQPRAPFGVRQRAEQIQRPGRVRGSFAVSVLAQRVLAGLPPILQRPLEVAATLEVHRQLAGDLAGGLAVAAFEALADPQVQARALADGDTRIEHALVERMDERVPARHGTIRPLRHTHGAQELAATCQRVAP